MEGSLPLQSLRLRSGSSARSSVQLDGATLQHSVTREGVVANLRLHDPLVLSEGKTLVLLLHSVLSPVVPHLVSFV